MCGDGPEVDDGGLTGWRCRCHEDVSAVSDGNLDVN
jgi:hypothetical protein